MKLTRRGFLKDAGLLAMGVPFFPGLGQILFGLPRLETTRLPNSLLTVPKEISDKGPAEVALFLTKLMADGKAVTTYKDLPYINAPKGGIPEEHQDAATLLTGKPEKGQSILVLDNEPLAAEVRLISGGQFILPLTDEAAKDLDASVVVRAQNPQKRSETQTHIVFSQVRLANGKPGLLIPGGLDTDRSVKSAEDNYNRGNLLIVLPATEQAETGLGVQVDAWSNWVAQFKLAEIVAIQDGINATDLLPYLLWSPNAQRSETHGMSTMKSMYEGPNCQGKGCRTADSGGVPIASMAGVGVYAVQIAPKSQGVNILAATVVPDFEIKANLG